MKIKQYIWASAGTLEIIANSIAKFYGGEQKELKPNSPDCWSIHGAKGQITSCEVVLKKGRYIFRETQANANMRGGV